MMPDLTTILSSIRLLTVVLTFSVLGWGCSETPSLDTRVSKSVKLPAGRLPYCLVRSSTNKRIYFAEPADFESGKDQDFRIVESHPQSASPIELKKDDRIELTFDSVNKEFDLVHTFQPGSTSEKVYVGKLKAHPLSDLSGSSAGRLLWASGRALDKGGVDLGGEYYIFSKAMHVPCMHPNNHAPGSSCKSVHVEFFKDDEMEEQKPGFPGVILRDGACNFGPKESQEGDGDHGPNR